jgi:hypothetical protein
MGNFKKASSTSHHQAGRMMLQGGRKGNCGSWDTVEQGKKSKILLKLFSYFGCFDLS